MTHRALASGSRSTRVPIPGCAPKSGLSGGYAPSYAEPSRLQLGAAMMAPRPVLMVLLVLALLAAPLAVEAQPTRNVHTIGFLGPPPSAGGLVQAFQQGLRDLGYVEGQNIRIEYRYTD